MSDITEPKWTEEVLRQIEERFRRLVEVMPVAVYVCDTSGIIQNYNNRAVELWGREPQTGGSGAALLRLFAPVFSRRHIGAPRGIENGGGAQDRNRGSRPGSRHRAARRFAHNGAGEYRSSEKCRRRIDRSHELLSGHHRSEARRRRVAAKRAPLAAGSGCAPRRRRGRRSFRGHHPQ